MSYYIAAGSMNIGVTYCSNKVINECNRNLISSYKKSGVIFFMLKNITKSEYIRSYEKFRM
ncbi:hypothetical protein [Rickettsia oklahomensis]|uniref:Uncharacterized protein n=1 Tax=Rickettsia oklahomensis TaxID=3141789 RepID=A0AAU7BZ25_9RICK